MTPPELTWWDIKLFGDGFEKETLWMLNRRRKDELMQVFQRLGMKAQAIEWKTRSQRVNTERTQTES
jgi:hypothetical protein